MQNNLYNVTTTNSKIFGNEDCYLEVGDLFCETILCDLITTKDIINKNDICVSNNVCVANDICTGNNINSDKIYSDSIICNNIQINGTCHLENVNYIHKTHGFLYINNLSLPLLYSFYDTSSIYINLNIQSMLVSGSFSCLIYPNTRLLFIADKNLILADIANQTSKIIYKIVTFNNLVETCTNIL